MKGGEVNQDKYQFGVCHDRKRWIYGVEYQGGKQQENEEQGSGK